MIDSVSWRSEDAVNFSILKQANSMVVSITEISAPALIAVQKVDEDAKILLGKRDSEITRLLVAKLAEILGAETLIALLGFKEELSFGRVKQILAEIQMKLTGST